MDTVTVSAEGLGQTCQNSAAGPLCQCAVGTCSTDGSCGGLSNPFTEPWTGKNVQVPRKFQSAPGFLHCLCPISSYGNSVPCTL